MYKTYSQRGLTKLKEKLVNVALVSDEFKFALGYAVEEITENAKIAENEATIEGLFDRVIYAILRDIGVNFNPQKEVAIETRVHFGKGRADSRIGGVLIEYKHRSKLKNDNDIVSAQKQLQNYAIALSKNNRSEIVGYLTDGLSLYETRILEGKVISSSGKLKISETNLLSLIKTIISLNESALIPENLIRDFCGANYDGVLFNVARILNNILAKKATQKTNMLMAEWGDLFSLAHNEQSQQSRIQTRKKILSALLKTKFSDSESESRALFALHTSYAIVLKLLAYRIISDIKFGAPLQNYKSLIAADSQALRSFCSDLEDGEIFRRLGILNLLEGDFFSWYCDKNQWNEDLAIALQEILEILGRYEDVSKIFSRKNAMDLFKELYEATVPQIVRATFGEFYTPFWLAQHVLEAASPKEKWRVIDPCCGSGTFIIAAMVKIREEMREQPKEEILKAALNRIAGVDLNPLAVLTTRVNFFIHIADLLPEQLENLVIPIFLGDSSYVPEKIEVDGVKVLRYKLRTLMSPIEIELPISLVSRGPEFVKLMYEYENLVKNEDLVKATELVLNAVNKQDRTEYIEKGILELTKQLVNLEKKKWNGIWARIITNFLTISCLGEFSCIIGNPPWIDWKNLPSGYREKIKSLCIDKGLFSGAGLTGGINLNVCALIAHVAINNWLTKDGKLAFLMPKELAYQPSYEGWRNAVGGSLVAFDEFHDWSKAGDPFYPVKEDFMTFVIGRKLDLGQRRKILPVFNYIKKDKNTQTWTDINQANSNLEKTQHYAGQITEGSTMFTFAESKELLRVFRSIAGKCYYIGREGIEFYPQELLIFEYDGKGPKDGTVFVKNIQIQKSKYKIPSQRILLETKYIYPLIRGRAVNKFSIENENFIVPFPYEKKDYRRPVEVSKLEKESPLLLSYYKKYASVIEAQTKFSDRIRGPNSGAFYGLARTGKYTFEDVHVVFRDNTKWGASVAKSSRMPWGENKGFVFQNHAVSICERADNNGYIDEDEAHYICAILNAPIVERFIYATTDMRSFKIRPPIFIPRYNGKDRNHKRLSELSRLAGGKQVIDPKIFMEIDSIYLKLCESRK